MSAEPRVIFVGNSATYFNDLPEMLRQLVPGLKYAQVTKGGQSLSGHACDPVVQWMITGEGPKPSPGCWPRCSHNESFFGDDEGWDGEGWDILVLQDVAASITDRIRGSDIRFKESLSALDTFASWVRIAAGKMRRHPSVILFHRCLYDYRELSQQVNTKLLCARGAEGIQQYISRLATHLGPDVPICVTPAMEAFCLVRNEGPDVLRQLYAGDGEHPSRIGTYLIALLFFQALTGRNPLDVPSYLPTDGDTRQHVDMRCSPEHWISSDAWQRDVWPFPPLPTFTEDLTQRLKKWAHRASTGDGPGATQHVSPKANVIAYSERYLQKVCEFLGREVQGPDLLITALKEKMSFDKLVAFAGDQLTMRFPIEVIKATFIEGEKIRAVYPKYYDAVIVARSPDLTFTVRWDDNDPDDTVKAVHQLRRKGGPIGSSLEVGSLVEAEFRGWHRATVCKAHDDGSYRIDWADDDERDRVKWPIDMMKLETVFVEGQRIRAMYLKFYDATVACIHPDGTVIVRWDDNDTDDTIKTLQQIRPKANNGEALRVGSLVEAEFRGWHRATVSTANGDGSYTVDWADNDERDRIKWPSDMRILESSDGGHANVAPRVELLAAANSYSIGGTVEYQTHKSCTTPEIIEKDHHGYATG